MWLKNQRGRLSDKRRNRGATRVVLAPVSGGDPNLIEAVGFLAGLCSVVSFAPQVRKLAATRDASGVSLKTYSITAIGFTLWTTYGALVGSLPVIASNSLSLAFVLVILRYRLKFGGS